MSKPTYEELEAQVKQLAAENAGLKAICDDRRTFIMNGVQLGYIKVPTVETDPALETIRIAVSPQEPTPATDAILASLRAEGVEMLRDSIQEIESAPEDTCDLHHYCTDFAAQLRSKSEQVKGVQS